MVADVLAEARAAGIELRVEGTRLRVLGDARAYTPALRATLLAHKHDLIELLHRATADGKVAYERAARAWAVEYVTHLARAHGYADEVVQVALSALTKQPPGRRFRVGTNAIVVEMGDGIEVRVRRTPQDWLDW